MKYLDETGLRTLWAKIKALIPSVVNNLNSTSTTNSLSANQGRVLKGLIDENISGEIEESHIADYGGRLWFRNGMLIQWGNVNIKPTAAGTVTSKDVTFTHTYDFAPFITAIPQTAYPANITTSIGVGTTTGGAKAGMKIYMTRTNTSETNFRWFAIGYKSV